MLTTLQAILPVFMVIATGFALHRLNIVGEDIWTAANHLCFFLLFPTLIIKTLATANLQDLPVYKIAAAWLGLIFAITVLLFALRFALKRLIDLSDASFTSLFQGVTRSHAFIALSITAAIYGDPGIAILSLTIAIFVPVLNGLNVTVLATLSDKRPQLKDLIKQVAQNPFIIACAIGIFLNLSKIGLPGPLLPTFTIIGGGALGLSLMSIGAALKLDMPASDRGLVVIGTALRLVLMPALMLVACGVANVDGLARSILVLTTAVPTAASGYVFAVRMGGNAPLMANLVTAQVICAGVTLPVALWVSQL